MINAGSRALGQFRIRTGRLARTARAARTLARARARARAARVPSPGTRRAVAVARRRRAARRRRSAQLSARALAQLCATHTRIPLIPHPSLTHTSSKISSHHNTHHHAMHARGTHHPSMVLSGQVKLVRRQSRCALLMPRHGSSTGMHHQNRPSALRRVPVQQCCGPAIVPQRHARVRVRLARLASHHPAGRGLKTRPL